MIIEIEGYKIKPTQKGRVSRDINTGAVIEYLEEPKPTFMIQFDCGHFNYLGSNYCRMCGGKLDGL